MSALLEAHEVSFAYSDEVVVLDRWSASFEPGEVVALTGRSGAGKSTLLYLLGLMLAPDAGEIVVEGVASARAADAERARIRASTFGFVFQDASLDTSRSVLDNITETALYRRQPLADARARGRELMARFGVELRADHRPGQISGGQAQRVALCRALLAAPHIVLADEPTGNLDQTTADLVIDALHDVAQSGGTVVVASHDPHLVSRCTRRIEL